MPNDLTWRLNEWLYSGMGSDAHFNITNRKFFMENDLSFETFGGNRLLMLKWLMKAKVFVKTPVPFYAYRSGALDSQTNSKPSIERIKKHIENQIQLSRHLNEYFESEEFFRNNKEFQYLVRSHIFSIFDNFWISNHQIYKNGITPELHSAIEDEFRKYFGADSDYITFLFHWVHTLISNKPVDVIYQKSK